jgi:opacity protein-like surface antigen
VKWPLGARGGRPTLTLEALAGGRYVSLTTEADFDLTAGPIRTKEELAVDVDWLDPFVGGRVRVDLSSRLTVAVRGDAGGFGVGSDLTWTVQGGVLFHVTRLFSVGAGYRVMDIDYSQGRGLRRFAFDVLLHGPELGLVFHF